VDGDAVFLPDPLLGPPEAPAALVSDDSLLFYGPIGESPLALIPYDQWGAIQIPTVGGPVFVPQRTEMWVAPANIPAADPALAVILDFLATFIVTDANMLAAWAPVAGAAGAAIIKRIFPHNPKEVVFSTSHLPALYLWRESATQEYAADDWLRETTNVKGLWVFPLAQQNNQRQRAPAANALMKTMAVAIERGRTPSWKQPDDLDQSSRGQGTLFYPYAAFESFKLVSWKDGRLEVKDQAKSATDVYPAVDITFAMEEKLDYGLGRYPVLSGQGAYLNVDDATGRVVVGGVLGTPSPSLAGNNIP
jgi:hypothetical protein